MAIEVFQIEWTKPQPLDKALTQSAAQEGGIYAIGQINANGTKLQYVGKTKEFYGRSSTHMNYASHLNTKTQLKKYFIAFGLISCFDKSRMSHDITPEQLKDVESFFINFYKPEGNSPATKKGYRGHPIIVFNTGKKVFKLKTLTNCPDLVKLLKISLAR